MDDGTNKIRESKLSAEKQDAQLGYFLQCNYTYKIAEFHQNQIKVQILEPPPCCKLQFPGRRRKRKGLIMAVSVVVLATITSLHLIAFILAVGAERRRNTAKVVPDEYDEQTYCVYGSDASTVYGMSAFGLLLISQAVVNGVTRCFFCGKGLISGKATTVAIFFFVFSWISFVGAEIGLLAGSAKNAYHTKYRAAFGGGNLSCATLRKGVFAGAAAMTVLSMVGSSLYYWAHSKADTGGWQKHKNEGLGLATAAPVHDLKQRAQFDKA